MIPACLKAPLQDGVVVGEGGGMGLGALPGERLHVGLVGQDGFVYGAGGLQQLPPPRHVLQVHADDLGAGIAAHVLQVIHLVQVGLVAHADELGEAGVVVLEARQEVQADAAALGDDAYPPAGYLDRHGHEGKAEAAVGVDDGEAVGAHETDAVAAGRLHQRVAQADTVSSAELLEPPGGDGQAGDALAAALIHRGRHGGGGDDEHRQVHRLRELGDRAIERVSQRLPSLGIDAVDRALVFPIDEVLEDVEAQVPGSLGDSDYRYAAGFEYAFHGGIIIAPG